MCLLHSKIQDKFRFFFSVTRFAPFPSLCVVVASLRSLPSSGGGTLRSLRFLLCVAVPSVPFVSFALSLGPSPLGLSALFLPFPAPSLRAGPCKEDEKKTCAVPCPLPFLSSQPLEA